MNCPIAHVMNMFGSVLKKPTTTTAATTTLSVPYIKLNDTNIYIYILHEKWIGFRLPIITIEG